jgi:PAS domain S-box-containing protein
MKDKKNSENNRITILIAEDSPTQAEQLKYILEKNNFKVVAAKDGKEAFALIQKNKPSLIISDIVMPEMNGYELCQKIKDDVKTIDIPVILLTSLSSSEDVLEGLSCGADNFLTKPYNEDYLISHIEQILANKKIDKGERVRVGVEILFGGKRRFITAGQQQMLTLLISTYEAAVQKNTELVKTQDELKIINENLEEMVRERTSDLMAEVAIRKRTEEQVIKLNRVYAVLSNINQAIVRIHDVGQLLKDVCLIAVDEGKFQIARIGIINTETQKFEHFASVGMINDYFKDIANDLAEENPITKVIKSAKNIISHDIENDNSIPEIFKENALCLGLKSFVTFPIRIFNNVVGGFSIYSNEVGFFDEKEINLLDEMANDISFALEYIQVESERIKAEEELKDSESSLRHAQEIANMGSWEWNLVTQKTNWSENYFAIHGIKPNDVEPSFEFFRSKVHPDDVQILDDTHANILKDKTPVNFELRIIQPDGTVKWIQNNIVPTIIDDKIFKLKGVIIDITEHKLAEEAIKESGKRFRELTDQMPLSLYEADLNGNLTYANNTALKNFGYSLEDFSKGLNLFKMIVQSDEVNVRERILSIINGGHIAPSEFLAQKKDGSIIPVIAYSNVIIKQGKPVGLRGFIFDISERKKSEEELIKLRKAVETSGEVIFMTDNQGTFSYINPQFTNTYGWTAEEIIGKGTPRILKSGNMKPEFYFTLWDILLNKKVFQWEFINRTKDGKILYMDCSLNPVLDDNGNIYGFLAIQKDITDRKKAENELIEAKEKAEEMNRLKTSFLANMSHELRTPMVGILGFSQILMETDELKEVNEIGKLVNISGKRLMETLNLILDMSRIESGELKLDYSEIDLVGEITQVISLFKPAADMKSLVISLKSKHENLIVSTDKKAIESIFNNLINNAIKFTSEGSVTVSLSKEKVKSQEWAIIEVTDTGIGIAEKDFDTIFTEFRQASEGLGRSFEGTGLGLTLTKKYVTLLGGSIAVKSKLNEGTTFTVRIPIKTFKEEISEILPEEPSAEQDIIPEGKKPTHDTILIVEDDELTIMLVLRMLKDRVFIDVARNAMEAIDKAQSKQYKAIFMDINLGKSRNGIFATGEIRKLSNYKNVPIAAMTAYAMDKDKEEFLSKGCTHYLAKPFTREQLNSLLDEVLKD